MWTCNIYRDKKILSLFIVVDNNNVKYSIIPIFKTKITMMNALHNATQDALKWKHQKSHWSKILPICAMMYLQLTIQVWNVLYTYIDAQIGTVARIGHLAFVGIKIASLKPRFLSNSIPTTKLEKTTVFVWLSFKTPLILQKPSTWCLYLYFSNWNLNMPIEEDTNFDQYALIEKVSSLCHYSMPQPSNLLNFVPPNSQCSEQEHILPFKKWNFVTNFAKRWMQIIESISYNPKP